MSTETPPPAEPSSEPQAGSVLPVVRRPRTGLSGGALAAVAVVGALILFAALNARREALTAPAIAPEPGEVVRGNPAIPSLFVPPEPAAAPEPIVIFRPAPARAAPQPQAQPAPPAYVPLPSYQVPAQPPMMAQRNASGTPLVLDTSSAAPIQTDGTSPRPGLQAAASNTASNTGRARAGMFADRATTVVQGTLIQAVLESGFDSSRAGFARAIVSRNIYGFDGTRVLIPRGSRLVGEYRSEAAQGQKRALINWTRLIRPDGATITIASPSADRLGRAGVRADVDSHFLERFSGAILQSVLDVGVNLASRDRSVQVVVPLQQTVNGGSGQNAQATQIPPTLKVKPGTSISVFVARDLDFTDVETQR